jgi:plasmid stabilization system protein ParE
MLRYELTTAAQEDLKDIARYTLAKWGRETIHPLRRIVGSAVLQNCR